MLAAKLARIALIACAGLMPLRADLRIRLKETSIGGSAVVTEYYKGTRWRRDFAAAGGWMVVDSASKQSIAVDPAKQEYTLNTFVRPKPAIDGSQTIVVDIETRDTGEQRQVFGHIARHLVTTERRHTEYLQKPPSEIREIATDGWYLDLDVPAAFPSHSRIGAVAVITSLSPHGRSSGVPRIEVTRRGPVPRGFPVWEKTGDNQTELTDFSEAPLDDSLFTPPAGYRRAIHPLPGERLSWADQLLFGWQQFQDWLAAF
jgi:hypothetical protein